ncbi:MAG: SIS domain-containing protein [Bdellovibrionales bacterium]
MTIENAPISLSQYLTDSATLLSEAARKIPAELMNKAVDSCVAALRSGAPLLVCGNGGSAADAMHITGELVGRFRRERQGLRCICLADNPATITAWANDVGYDSIFARQVEAYGVKGGVLLLLTTSGQSPNLVLAAQKAHEMGMTNLGFTGKGGGALSPLCDIQIDAPGNSTADIQQVHICLYHYLCDRIEALSVTGLTNE